MAMMETDKPRLSRETEFGADPQVPATTEVTGEAYTEMNLSDSEQTSTWGDVSGDLTNLSAPLASVASSGIPSTAAPSTIVDDPIEETPVKYREQQQPLVQSGAPNTMGDFDEADALPGVVYRDTTIPKPGEKRRGAYKKLAEIYGGSSGTYDFFRNLKVYLYSCGGNWLWITIFAIFALYPLAMIIVGITGIGKCTVQPAIPAYLIVAGVFSILALCLAIFDKWPRNTKPRSVSTGSRRGAHLLAMLSTRVLATLIHIFLIIWFVIGCFWVFSVSSTVEYDDMNHEYFCNGGLYMFAFWTLILTIILFVFLFFVIVGLICLVIAVQSKTTRTLS